MTYYSLHLFSTFAIFGIIWVIQTIHYSLFNLVEKDKFEEYISKHSLRITFIVGPLMIVELFTGVMLFLNPSKYMPYNFATIGLLLILLIWFSTVFIQSPLFFKLSKGFSNELHKKLVKTNWIRTICWTLRVILIAISFFYSS